MDIKNMKIMIVDDNEDNLDLLEAILESEGYKNIIKARSAEEMFELLKRGERPDLILLDVMMPGMDGFTACKILKESDRWKDIPVIMVTAKTSPEDLKRGFEVGAMDYIEKPISDVELIARVESALKTKLELDRYKVKDVETVHVFRLIRDAMQSNEKKIELIEEIMNEIERLSFPDGVKERALNDLRKMKEDCLEEKRILENVLGGLF